MSARHKRAHELMSHWSFWVGIAYFGLALVVTWLYFVNSQTLKKDAVHKAEVNRCMASRSPLGKFARHVRGVNDLALVLVENSAHVLETTPKSDPQYMVRKTNLERLVRARDKVAALPNFHVPSVRDCRALGK